MSAPIFGRSYVVALPGLLSAANPGAYLNAPTISADDLRVYKDNQLVVGGLDTLPVNDPPGSPRLRLSLSADEMSCQQLLIYFHSVAGLWSDVAFDIQPRSSQNAGYIDLVLGGGPDNNTWIKVRKTGAVATGPDAYGVRVKMEVIEAAGVDREIFVYHKRPLDPTQGTFIGDFDHICSPTDFGNYPVDNLATEVDRSHLPEFYRSAFVDLLLDSIQAADEFERVVWEDIYLLKRNVDRLSRLTTPVIAIAGNAPTIANVPVDFPGPPPLPTPTYGSTDTTVALSTIARNIPATNLTSWNETSQNISLTRGQNSTFLVLQGFDFTEVPANALLVGLTVALNVASSPPGKLEWLKLHLPTGPAGDNLAATAPVPGMSDPTLNYSLSLGGAANLLGSGATVADIKRGEFGLILLAEAAYGDTQLTVTGASITAHWKPVA